MFLDLQDVAWGLKNYYGQGGGKMRLSSVLDWMGVGAAWLNKQLPKV
jgi:hypothetical protein